MTKVLNKTRPNGFGGFEVRRVEDSGLFVGDGERDGCRCYKFDPGP